MLLFEVGQHCPYRSIWQSSNTMATRSGLRILHAVYSHRPSYKLYSCQTGFQFEKPTMLGSERRYSSGALKTFNGYGTKTPFLIGVSGGTASGKVSRNYSQFSNRFTAYGTLVDGMQPDYGETRPRRDRPQATPSSLHQPGQLLQRA